MEDMNISDGDTLADEVKINLNMFGALMLDGVGGEVDCGDVITIDQGGPLGNNLLQKCRERLCT
jgi:hypothetical protein